MLQNNGNKTSEPIKYSWRPNEQPKSDYELVCRQRFPEYVNNLRTSQFQVSGVNVGTKKPLIIAGPCTVHSRQQTLEIARGVKEAGADMLRGGAYKPRTSPYAFQGLGIEALEILAEAREETGLPIVTEVMEPGRLEEVGSYADVIQIGSRSMQNYPLLIETGRYAAAYDKGVLLKTSLKPTLKEVLCAAEYLALQGAEKIILCERGMNVTAGNTRNTPNPMFLLELREHTYLPVIGDPSHSTGHTRYVRHASNMYLQAGANGLIIEVIRDDEPERIGGVAVCDREQGMPLSQFKRYIQQLRKQKVLQELDL